MILGADKVKDTTRKLTELTTMASRVDIIFILLSI